MTEERFEALHEVVAAARKALPAGPWGYLIGGAETETTVARNRAAFDSLAFRPRVLRDVSSPDLSATLFGRSVRLPVMIAPVGQLNHFHPGAAATVARAAAEFGVAQFLSSASPPSLLDVADAAGSEGLLVYQLYVSADPAETSDRIAEVTEAGYAAFCVTVDTARYSRRERDFANRWGLGWRVRGFDQRGGLDSLSWAEVDRMRSELDIPLILKGIATPEDAELAIEHGAEVVYVSNHGGRQLDHGLGSAAVLPEIVDRVAGRAQVFVDGGINRGADIVKAMALGADAVAIGRTACYGVAAGGEAGLVTVLELLEDEVVRTMGLLGINGWDELDRSYLTEGPLLSNPDVLSAYPLLS